ncbi:hypothetical protein WH43_00315 [Rheinheimera sp. KL1]|uniref:hypothetical protein n=1 Tax=Rheinheimera sp. KL1 TaxID=1635005 RepID=UPI0006A97B85|nr:hypothetical protein [Rheinheimera sp. KL1]KOO60100.1 hypothetical protein WH43_00315 [Rheinheimera sp. KL1]
MTAEQDKVLKLYALLHRKEMLSELLKTERPEILYARLAFNTGLDGATLRSCIADINSSALRPLNPDFYKLWEPYRYNNALEELLWMPANAMTDSAFFADHLVKLRSGLVQTMLRPKVALASVDTEWVEENRQTVNIFHLSRCGSTLAARAFHLLAGSRLLSESPVLTEFLLNTNQPAAERQHYLQLLISLQGRLTSQEKQLVIKWNCWDLAYFSEICQSSPMARQIFLFRHPEEILASHILNGAGRHMVPNQNIPSSVSFHPEASLLGWRIEVLKQLMSQMLQVIKTHKIRVLVFDYADLSASTLLRMTGINPVLMTDSDHDKLKRLLNENVKIPDQQFKADEKKKRQLFTPTEKKQINVLFPLYEELRRYRTVI